MRGRKVRGVVESDKWETGGRTARRTDGQADRRTGGQADRPCFADGRLYVKKRISVSGYPNQPVRLTGHLPLRPPDLNLQLPMRPPQRIDNLSIRIRAGKDETQVLGAAGEGHEFPALHGRDHYVFHV